MNLIKVDFLINKYELKVSKANNLASPKSQPLSPFTFLSSIQWNLSFKFPLRYSLLIL